MKNRSIVANGSVVSSFSDALRQCIEYGGALEKIFQKRQVRRIESHLSNLKCATVVIESNYVDHDFLEDYAHYYVRCFRQYDRTCIRLHFFSEEFSLSKIDSIVLGEDKALLDKAKKSYLGFVVVRPLQNTIIGRSCLIPCQEHCGDKRCHFDALCDVDVSFFGQKFTIRCMPFQEQDRNVSSCATSALWSTFNVTSRLFSHPTLSPAKITLIAKSNGASLRRAIPSREGLLANEMAYVIRHLGLDVVAVSFHRMKDSLRKNSLLGNIYAYLSIGIPVVLLGTFLDSDKNGEKITKKHAIVVNGYGMNNECRTLPILPEERLYACDLISEIFVNDDCVGPYVNLRIPKIEQRNSGLDRVDMLTLWHERNECPKPFQVLYLLAPVYEKIRVSYEEVWNMAYPFDSWSSFYFRAIKMKWQIRLVRSNAFKESFRNKANVSNNDRLRVLKLGMPKYLWEITVLLNDVENAIFCVDATDAGQGLNIILSVFLYSDLLKIAYGLRQKGCFEIVSSAINDVCFKALRDNYSQDEFSF